MSAPLQKGPSVVVCNTVLHNYLLTVLQLCQRLSDNKCWAVEPHFGGGFHFVDIPFQFSEHWYPLKQLDLNRFVQKFDEQEHFPVLPDLEDDEPVEVTIKNEEQVTDSKQCTLPASQLTVAVHRHLVSRRYVYSTSIPSSHAALKPFCGSVKNQDNSNAAYIRHTANWKNEVMVLSSFTQHLTLPLLLRILTSNNCGLADHTVKQCMQRLSSYRNAFHLYALYSAMKALTAFHPRSSQAVNSCIVEKLPEDTTDDIERTRIQLVLDYVVSSVELHVLHYPLLQHRELNRLFSVDSPLIQRLIAEAEKDGCTDVKILALLQRALNAVGTSDKWRSVDRLTSKLYRLYRRTHRLHSRQQLLTTVAAPQLRLKLAESVLGARCCSYVHQPSKRFLTADNMRALSSLLSEWLHPSSLSHAVGSIDNQVEEYLAVLVTLVECNLHLQKGMPFSIVFVDNIILEHLFTCEEHV